MAYHTVTFSPMTSITIYVPVTPKSISPQTSSKLPELHTNEPSGPLNFGVSKVKLDIFYYELVSRLAFFLFLRNTLLPTL
jgi:hypothetical protein